MKKLKLGAGMTCSRFRDQEDKILCSWLSGHTGYGAGFSRPVGAGGGFSKPRTELLFSLGGVAWALELIRKAEMRLELWFEFCPPRRYVEVFVDVIRLK